MERTEQEGFLVGAILGVGIAVLPFVGWFLIVVYDHVLSKVAP